MPTAVPTAALRPPGGPTFNPAPRRGSGAHGAPLPPRTDLGARPGAADRIDQRGYDVVLSNRIHVRSHSARYWRSARRTCRAPRRRCDRAGGRATQRRHRAGPRSRMCSISARPSTDVRERPVQGVVRVVGNEAIVAGPFLGGPARLCSRRGSAASSTASSDPTALPPSRSPHGVSRA